MVIVVWTVAVDYLVALCIYAVASLTLAGGQGCWLNGRVLHNSSKYVLRSTPPVDVWRVSHVPDLPKGGPVGPCTDVVDHVAVKNTAWLHDTKDDVTHHQ